MTSDTSHKKPVVNTITDVLAEDQANASLMRLMLAQQNALNARAAGSSAIAPAPPAAAQSNSSGGTSEGAVSAAATKRNDRDT